MPASVPGPPRRRRPNQARGSPRPRRILRGNGVVTRRADRVEGPSKMDCLEHTAVHGPFGPSGPVTIRRSTLTRSAALNHQMKRLLAALLLFAASALPAAAQSYSDIDVDLPAFPEMQPVPNSPVYWPPGVDSNYFF